MSIKNFLRETLEKIYPHLGEERIVPGKSIKFAIKDHAMRYEFASKYVKDKIVLDISCGTGYGSEILKSKKARKVYGGDISKEAIDYAKNHYKEIEFSTMDAEKIPFKENFFDIIVSMETLEHLKNPEKFSKESYRILKNGGLLILSTPDKLHSSKLLGNKFHIKEFTKKEIEELFSNFSEIKVMSYMKKRNMIKRISINLGLINYSKDFYNVVPYSLEYMDLIVICKK